MIDPRTFDKEWILKVKGEERSDQGIIERQIHGLHLLEILQANFKHFIFKGGTCLSLISSDFPRFSIDIDILVDPKYKDFFLVENLVRVIGKSQFTSVVEDFRTPRYDIDKQHFEFHYNGAINGETYILLDVVFDESSYRDLVEVEINNYLLQSTPPFLKVITPSVHDLLADKLCAFAPNTIGKKLNEGRDVEVVKQMFDVSFLMKHYRFSPSYKEIYETISKAVISRRKATISVEDVLKDTIRTSINIVSEGILDKEQYQNIKRAIRGFSSYTRDLSFNLEKAKESALDALFASLLVIAGSKDKFDGMMMEPVEYLAEYSVFKSTRKQLAAIDAELVDLFNGCLRYMSCLNISLK
ncbi:MAG: nucleotidyl transferase AbiEii/AbiGii toxin family protein [Candidatus Izemoplasmatales bacterium]